MVRPEFRDRINLVDTPETAINSKHGLIKAGVEKLFREGSLSYVEESEVRRGGGTSKEPRLLRVFRDFHVAPHVDLGLKPDKKVLQKEDYARILRELNSAASSAQEELGLGELAPGGFEGPLLLKIPHIYIAERIVPFGINSTSSLEESMKAALESSEEQHKRLSRTPVKIFPTWREGNTTTYANFDNLIEQEHELARLGKETEAAKRDQADWDDVLPKKYELDAQLPHLRITRIAFHPSIESATRAAANDRALPPSVNDNVFDDAVGNFEDYRLNPVLRIHDMARDLYRICYRYLNAGQQASLTPNQAHAVQDTDFRELIALEKNIIDPSNLANRTPIPASVWHARWEDADTVAESLERSTTLAEVPELNL